MQNRHRSFNTPKIKHCQAKRNMNIEEGLCAVRESIARAAEKAGKKSSDIKLVAVSKFKSTDEIRTAVALGVTDFGENYIQEFVGKYTELADTDIMWHIIGNVQRNKVKYIADKKLLVQTVDKPALAEALSVSAEKLGKTIPVLLQVNTSGEASKSGCKPEELFELFDKCLECPGIDVQGLMTIGPNTDDIVSVETCFANTQKLFDSMKSNEKTKGQIKYLSMGMTNDYTLAIKHGANIVRIGRAIFGER